MSIIKTKTIRFHSGSIKIDVEYTGVDDDFSNPVFTITDCQGEDKYVSMTLKQLIKILSVVNNLTIKAEREDYERD